MDKPNLSEVQSAVLSDVMTSWLLEAQGETMSVILRIPGLDAYFRKIQDAAVQLMPDLRDFETEYHVTLAYASGLSLESITAALPRVVEALRDKSFTFDIGPVQSLVNQKGEGVMYLGVNDSGITNLHFALRKILTEAGAVFTFPGFKGHVTMAYRDTPIDPEALATMNRVPTKIGVMTNPSDFKVTRKAGDEWERLA